ncbi:MAG: hypothetical protein ACREMZ_15735 [Gemmatimonadales bacterium]
MSKGRWIPIRRPEHPRKAEAKRMYEVEGLGLAQISRTIGVPKGTVHGWANTWVRRTRVLEFKAREDASK